MNPYTPPNATVADPLAQPGSPIKAVCLGLLVDTGGTILFSTLFGIAHAVVLVTRGMTSLEATAVIQAAQVEGWAFVISTAIGCAFSVLGGYVCARISRRSKYELGWVMGGISAVLGLLIGWSSYTPFKLAVLTFLTFASILLGFKLGMPKAEAEPLH
jgi:hypothetical protein